MPRRAFYPAFQGSGFRLHCLRQPAFRRALPIGARLVGKIPAKTKTIWTFLPITLILNRLIFLWRSSMDKVFFNGRFDSLQGEESSFDKTAAELDFYRIRSLVAQNAASDEGR